MSRIRLIPTRTSDGRHVILRGVVVGPAEQLLESLRRLFGRSTSV